MKSKINWVRRSQRVIRMVSELHRMGYQHLRIMPYAHPNAWRLALGPRDIFSKTNGVSIPHADLSGLPIYSAAGEGDAYFGWTDTKGNDARTLADKFIERFPDVAKRSWGRDWSYAGWLAELIGFLEEGDLLPVTEWESMKETPEHFKFLPIWNASGNNVDWDGLMSIPGPDVRQFPLPPFGQFEQPNSTGISQDKHARIDINLLNLLGEGGGLNLVLRKEENGIYSYRLDSNSSEAASFYDEDFNLSEYEFHSSDSICPLVFDWQGALKLLDDHGWPWPLFTPIYKHPSISTGILTALKERYSRYPDIDFNRWDACV